MTYYFDKAGFMAFLQERFNGFDNCFLRDVIENIIDYAIKYKHVTCDALIYFLLDIIPDVSFGEIAVFCNDDILTAYGKTEKKKQLQI